MLLGPVPGGKPIWYRKHMTLYMLDSFGRDWMSQVRNAFLIRNPEAVLASYVLKRDEVTLADIGFVQQRELFEREADRLGAPPPVADSADIMANPAQTHERLCKALGVPYTSAMLKRPPGHRAMDGVWAPAWYESVENSVGLVKPKTKIATPLPPYLQRLADQARPFYETLKITSCLVNERCRSTSRVSRWRAAHHIRFGHGTCSYSCAESYNCGLRRQKWICS